MQFHTKLVLTTTSWTAGRESHLSWISEKTHSFKKFWGISISFFQTRRQFFPRCMVNIPTPRSCLSEVIAPLGKNPLILILKFDLSSQFSGVSSNAIWKEAKRHGGSCLQEKDRNLEKLFRELKDNRPLSYLARCISAEIQVGADQGNEDKNELHHNSAQNDSVK